MPTRQERKYARARMYRGCVRAASTPEALMTCEKASMLTARFLRDNIASFGRDIVLFTHGTSSA